MSHAKLNVDAIPKDALGDKDHPCPTCGWGMHLLFTHWSCGLCSGALDAYMNVDHSSKWFDLDDWQRLARVKPGDRCDHNSVVYDSPCPVGGCAYGLFAPHEGIYRAFVYKWVFLTPYNAGWLVHSVLFEDPSEVGFPDPKLQQSYSE